ncbi:glycosyltransferase [Sphingopyxis granuli]|uniref:Glycosyltransferase n=1 Tax=Sphingopyxis granuli TaxID=267128 RepID=A0AA86GMC2_9SPHN|nr:glycosyltransferase [Sphingopyxis granuli]AMG74734.1 Glycosyltransferase [Sphingopyxis granuli]
MKILFLTSSMEGGGAERVAALLANAWDAKGHDVTLMPTFSGRGECVYPLSAGVHLEFLSDAVGENAGKITRLRALRAIIKAANPDVILSFMSHVNVAALLAAGGTGIPVIACERTYPPGLSPPLPLSYRLLRRLTYPFAAALVAQTRATADWMRARAPRTEIAILPNPVILPMKDTDPAIPIADHLETPDRLVLWVGRMDDAKRPSVMVDAFAAAAGSLPGWKLVMLGDGPLRDRIRSELPARGLESRILLPGFAGNLRQWYERADIYAMTSSYEGFPNSLLEAMAHGTASVVFDVKTGPAQLSDAGQRAILLPDNRHVERLAASLCDLGLHPERRAVLAASAREVVELYSREAILDQWQRLFASATARQDDPSSS